VHLLNVKDWAVRRLFLRLGTCEFAQTSTAQIDIKQHATTQLKEPCWTPQRRMEEESRMDMR